MLHLLALLGALSISFSAVFVRPSRKVSRRAESAGALARVRLLAVGSQVIGWLLSAVQWIGSSIVLGGVAMLSLTRSGSPANGESPAEAGHYVLEE